MKQYCVDEHGTTIYMGNDETPKQIEKRQQHGLACLGLYAQLSDKTCRECQKPIKVAEYSPHPLQDDATGMAAYRWGGNDGLQSVFVGWICDECAWNEALKEGGRGGIGGGGGSLDFFYN